MNKCHLSWTRHQRENAVVYFFEYFYLFYKLYTNTHCIRHHINSMLHHLQLFIKFYMYKSIKYINTTCEYVNNNYLQI